MVCAIRPGHQYYDETINTLKYADRAKKIKNKPVVNESPQDKLIKELQEENRKLKEAMGNGGLPLPGDDDLASQKAEMEAKLKQLEELEKNWEEKMNNANGQRDAAHADHEAELELISSGRPYIVNLDEDGMVNRHVMFDLSKNAAATVGRKNKKNPAENPLVILGHITICSKHAVFETTETGTTLKAQCKEAVEYIFINGKPLKDQKPVTLKPNDRIILGISNAFLFKQTAKDAEASMPDTPEKPITYDFVMREKSDSGANKMELLMMDKMA